MYFQPVRVPRVSTPWTTQYTGPAFGPVTVTRVQPRSK